jgi:hypothetical protein
VQQERRSTRSRTSRWCSPPIAALGAALRWSRWPRFALGIGTVAFFVVLTGAEPSVRRADLP